VPTFTITPSGPFDLRAAAGFGFGPRAGAETPAEARMRHFYGPDRASTEIAEAWRPYRTWGSVLLHSAGRRAGIEPER